MNASSQESITSLSRKLFESAPQLNLISVSCAVCGSRETITAAEGYDYEYATSSNIYTFCGCRSCGHLYLNPRPSTKDLGVIYPSTYYAFAENQAGNPVVGYFRKIWEAAKIKDFRKLAGSGKKKILDVGCGEGRFLSLLKEYGDPVWELVGLDLDEKAAELCRRKGFRCETARIEDFAKREKFDVIIMFQLIEHVDNPRLVIESMRGMLTPGGILVLETPNPRGLDYNIFKKSWWAHYHFPRHWHLFTPESLGKILVESGYVDIQSSSLLAPAAWIVSLHNFFLAKNYPKPIVDFFYFQNPLLLGIFVVFDLICKTLGMQTSNQRVTARVAS